MPRKIDVHSHFLPPFYRDACLQNGHQNPDGMPFLPPWDPDEHIELMNNSGISESILSISSPGCYLRASDDAFARKLARDCNSYAASLKRRKPDRFGYFASLCLPDVEGSLEEIALAAEEGCDGFVLETNHHGHYLGDQLFDPVFDELNRRGALLFIHPTTPLCPCSPEARAAGAQPVAATPFAGKLPNPTLEFLFDTSRAVTNLFLSGTVRRCPNLKIILPHLGGAFPPMLSRWTTFSSALPGGQWKSVTEDEAKKALAEQMWFDMAGVPFPGQIRGLLAGVGVSHTRLLYGSDYPFTRPSFVKTLLDQLENGVKELFSEDQIKDVYYRNAEQLLESTGRVQSRLA